MSDAATPGSWKVKPVEGYTTDYLVTDHPDHQTKPHGNYVAETGFSAGHKEQRFSQDAIFIVAAVNYVRDLIARTAGSSSTAPGQDI